MPSSGALPQKYPLIDNITKFLIRLHLWIEDFGILRSNLGFGCFFLLREDKLFLWVCDSLLDPPASFKNHE